MRQKKSKGKGLFTLDGGMQQLCQTIAKKADVKVHLGSVVDEVRQDGILVQGQFFQADQIYCALPASAASSLLRKPLEVRSQTFHVVNLGYFGDVLPKKGYGYLVPSKEGEPLLGMIWDSALFLKKGQTVVTAMVRDNGGDPVTLALQAMQEHLSVHKPPDATHVSRAEVPQYEINHQKKICHFQRQIADQYPCVHLLGNYLCGASVDSCIQRAQKKSIN